MMLARRQNRGIASTRRGFIVGAGVVASAPALGQTLRGAYRPQERLGVSRVVPVGTRGGLQVGRFQFPRTLPLGPREVVLTFDDGPVAATTPRVLQALAAVDARATFFMIGRNAASDPATARAVARAGHRIGHHSMTHPAPMTNLPTERAIADVSNGMDAIRQALGPDARAFAPGFFRYPGLWNPPAVDAWLGARNIGTFGIDVHARDWELTDPTAVVDLAMSRLNAQGRGILLLHDNQPVTAVALPALLARLRVEGWRVVEMVPA